MYTCTCGCRPRGICSVVLGEGRSMGSILSWEERLGLYKVFMVSGREKYGKYTELGGEVRATW